LMKEAGFVTVFVGIETPEADALRGMRKDQNLMVPLLESIQTLNNFGLEITAGMIIGLDTDSDGRYDTLEVETRHLRGPRVWDQSGMPMGNDNATVIKERIYLDKSDPGTLRVEMTTTDSSLTRPWTVMKTFKRQATVWWTEDNCPEGQAHVTIGKEVYFQSGDGTIMPMKKDQPPPDLKYFKRN